MNNTFNSACVLFKGDHSECVARSLNLIGTILNNSFLVKDSNVLLICTRSSWEKAIESYDSNVASSFYPSELDYFFHNSTNNSKEFVHNLFEHCFRQKSIKVNPESDHSKNEDNERPPNNKAEDLFAGDSDEGREYEGNADNGLTDTTVIQADDLYIPGTSECMDCTNPINGSTNSSGSSNNNKDIMKRLLIRFIDDVPTRTIMDGKLLKCLSEQNNNPFWNYIRASNEISVHGGVVVLVVVAGLSEIVSNSSSRYLNTTTDGDGHPFTSSIIPEGNIRYYHTRSISMYTLALSMSINAVNSRIRSLNDIDEWVSSIVPPFILVDSLPSDDEDSNKFTKFISERVGYTYVLR